MHKYLDAYILLAIVMANSLVVNLCIIHFLVPTVQKLELYLEKVTDWEAFGYQLLPEEKEYLLEVTACTYIGCSLLCNLQLAS